MNQILDKDLIILFNIVFASTGYHYFTNRTFLAFYSYAPNVESVKHCIICLTCYFITQCKSLVI